MLAFNVAEPTKDPDRTLFRIAGVGAALAFGGMIGTLFAVRSTPAGLTFQVTVPAVLAFLGSAVLAWFYWRMVAGMASDQLGAKRKRKKFVWFSIALITLGITSFLYPMRFVSPEKRGDVFVGLAMAIAVLGGVAFVMWQVIRFLAADQKHTEDEERR